MSSAFLIDYIVWVYISTLGVIQFAAVRSGLLGMLFIRRWPKATLVATVVTVLSAFTWYFASAERNQPDTGLGLDANVQAFWFATSATLAAGTTLAISSITNYRWGRTMVGTSAQARLHRLGSIGFLAPRSSTPSAHA